MRRRLMPTLAPLLLVTLALAGCSSAATPSESTAADPAAATTTETDAAVEPDASATTDPAAALPECDGILFEQGAEIPGRQLGDCMAAAMFAAGSGSHRVDASDGTSSTVQFEWTPEFSMVIDGSNAGIVRGDTGWVQLGTGWVQADPSSTDPEVVIATSVVEAIRTFGDPRIMAAAMAASDWLVVGEGPVMASAGLPATGAVADTAWHLEPTGPLNMGPVTVSDYQLWLGSDYLGVYNVGTGTWGDISTTTSNTFLQWGQPVEIPDPSQP